MKLVWSQPTLRVIEQPTAEQVAAIEAQRGPMFEFEHYLEHLEDLAAVADHDRYVQLATYVRHMGEFARRARNVFDKREA